VPSLDWIGHCGEVTVLLTTSKESMITRTPIYRCLADETRSLTLEGFGVAHAAPTSSSGVELLPLVLGVNLG
jgi:hypothetical protein